MKKGMSHDIRLMDCNTGEIYSDVMRMLFIPMASVKKNWDECDNEYEKIVFLIKNMHKMDKNSKPYKSGEFNDYFEAAEIGPMAKEDIVAYSQSYDKMIETQRAIDYAVEQATSKGEAIGNYSRWRRRCHAPLPPLRV